MNQKTKQILEIKKRYSYFVLQKDEQQQPPGKKIMNSILHSIYFVLYKNLLESLGHALRSVNLQLVTFWLLQEKKKSTIQGVK